MSDMGLVGMGGAAGAGDAIEQLFKQRYAVAQLNQQDALTRLKAQEQAEAVTARLEQAKQAESDRKAATDALAQDRKDRMAVMSAQLRPIGSNVTPGEMATETGAGIPSGNYTQTPAQPQGLPSTQFSPIGSGPKPMPMELSPIQGRTPQPMPLGPMTRIEQQAAPAKPASITWQGTQAQQQKQTEDTARSEAAAQAAANASPEARFAEHQRNRLFDAAHPLTDPGKGDTSRLDKSYDTQTKRLDSIEKPIQDQAERIGRLRTVMNQMTPQADTLIAPELLTITAGGMGSGLRMNEAEIARVVGGRTQWESLKARLDAWQTDPTKPFSVTPEQRTQMRALVKEIATRAQKRLSMLDDARSQMVDATDVVQHRKIVDAVSKAFNAESLGSDEAAGGVPVVGGSFQGGKVLKVEKAP